MTIFGFYDNCVMLPMLAINSRLVVLNTQ